MNTAARLYFPDVLAALAARLGAPTETDTANAAGDATWRTPDAALHLRGFPDGHVNAELHEAGSTLWITVAETIPAGFVMRSHRHASLLENLANAAAGALGR